MFQHQNINFTKAIRHACGPGVCMAGYMLGSFILIVRTYKKLCVYMRLSNIKHKQLTERCSGLCRVKGTLLSCVQFPFHIESELNGAKCNRRSPQPTAVI